MELPSNIFTKLPPPHPSQGDVYQCFFARPAQPPTPEHVILVSESGLVPRCIGNQPPTCSEDFHFAIGSGPHHLTLPEKIIELPIRPLTTISQFRPVRRLEPLIEAPERPRLKLEPSSNRSSAFKVTSNDKHKQSEKHRRDEMSAYVQAAEIIRGTQNLGLHSPCSFCHRDMSIDESRCSSPTLPDDVTATVNGVISKKTKNQSIEEGLMYQFYGALHSRPNEVGSRLDDVRALVSQMWRDRQIGKNNDFTKSSKWEVDSGAEALMETLRKMRDACESHDVPPCACGKHQVDDWPTGTSGVQLTPPSSSSMISTTAGQKRSREVTDKEDELKEKTRVTRRSMARL